MTALGVFRRLFMRVLLIFFQGLSRNSSRYPIKYSSQKSLMVLYRDVFRIFSRSNTRIISSRINLKISPEILPWRNICDDSPRIYSGDFLRDCIRNSSKDSTRNSRDPTSISSRDSTKNYFTNLSRDFSRVSYSNSHRNTSRKIT